MPLSFVSLALYDSLFLSRCLSLTFSLSCLRAHSLSTSLSLAVFLSLSLCLYMFICLCLRPSLSLSLSLFLSHTLSPCVSFSPHGSISLYLLVSPCLSPSLCLSLTLYITLLYTCIQLMLLERGINYMLTQLVHPHTHAHIIIAHLIVKTAKS